MSVVPSLSSLTALLLLVGRVATQGKSFLVICVSKKQQQRCGKGQAWENAGGWVGMVETL